MNQNRLITVALLAFTLSGCAGSQSVTPSSAAPALAPDVTTIAMTIRNGTKVAVTMAPQSTPQTQTCMRRVPPTIKLAPNQTWKGTIALDKPCAKHHWSFTLQFTGSLPEANGGWSKEGTGHWLLFSLSATKGLQLQPGTGGDIFNITLVKGKLPR